MKVTLSKEEYEERDLTVPLIDTVKSLLLSGEITELMIQPEVVGAELIVDQKLTGIQSDIEHVGVFSVDGANNNLKDFRDKTKQPTHCTQMKKGKDHTCKYFPTDLDPKKNCPNRTCGKYCCYVFENGGPKD